MFLIHLWISKVLPSNKQQMIRTCMKWWAHKFVCKFLYTVWFCCLGAGADSFIHRRWRLANPKIRSKNLIKQSVDLYYVSYVTHDDIWLFTCYLCVPSNECTKHRLTASQKWSLRSSQHVPRFVPRTCPQTSSKMSQTCSPNQQKLSDHRLVFRLRGRNLQHCMEN